jgi:hypothetical protein
MQEKMARTRPINSLFLQARGALERNRHTAKRRATRGARLEPRAGAAAMLKKAKAVLGTAPSLAACRHTYACANA